MYISSSLYGLDGGRGDVVGGTEEKGEAEVNKEASSSPSRFIKVKMC